jgi:arginine:ornithine antiporter/lysine permease
MDQYIGSQPDTVTTPAAGKKATKADGRKLGLLLLTGVVVGSMIGGGSFNLPQNMASAAGLGAVTIAWIVTLVGMFFLANAFRTLADQRPDLKAGIYRYAQEGFGRFAGFEMAWGYWLSAAFGNVAFAVLIMQILGYFFPIFGDGRNWPSILGGSALIWTMHFTVLSGMRRAAALTVFASFVNVITIGVAVIVMALFIQKSQFSFDIWGQGQQLGSVLTQVKSTMLVTLWVFIGIEAAVVVSDRARVPHQVGAATFIGLAVCTTLYFLLSALPFGLMHQKELAGLSNPSSAYILQVLVGHWGAIFINVSLLFSVLFCWLAWTMLVAELPFEGAKGGVFPKILARENKHHAAAPSLWISSLVMQATMFVVLFAHDAWIWLISITGVMVLPPYLASTAFLWKFASSAGFSGKGSENRRAGVWTGILGTIYGVWLLYAAGPQFLLMSTIFFALGLPVFWYAQRERNPGKPAFTRTELTAAFVLVAVAIAAIFLFGYGIVKFG